MALQQVEVDEPVGIGFEDALARVSALCDMMRDVNCDDASESGHKTTRASRATKGGARERQTFSGNVPSVPGFPRPVFPSPREPRPPAANPSRLQPLELCVN